MAPSSAGSQPPFVRSDVAERKKQSQQAQGGEAPEAYGPLGIERHIKDHGRMLILYARREREDA
jgi:hypothetical protein